MSTPTIYYIYIYMLALSSCSLLAKPKFKDDEEGAKQ